MTRTDPIRVARNAAFVAKMTALRANPRNCGRCGKPRDGERKQCARCLNRQAMYRGQKFEERMTSAGLLAVVKQLRREMDKLQVRFKLWQKAVDYRKSLKYRTNAMRKKHLKTVGHAEAMDYLAETNHAYAETQAG